MRRWELVSGGSAKFWEVGQDGAVVTVRFGRLDTHGQTQTKELASAEAAQAHVAKLVAEKEKKGYRAVASAGTGPSGPQPPTRSPPTPLPPTPHRSPPPTSRCPPPPPWLLPPLEARRRRRGHLGDAQGVAA